jgi:hypothetical protein
MKITKRCRFDGKIYEMDFPHMTEQQYATALMRCDLGALIQDAFHFLDANEREFIMTGTPPHVWDEMFCETNTNLENESSNRKDYSPDELAASDANNRHYND